MSNTNTVTKNKESELDQAMKLQEMTLEQLQERATQLGVELQSDDKTDLIQAILDKTEEVPEDAVEGHLVSLHSKTDDAVATIRKVRNIIATNEAAKKYVRVFRKNQDGNFFMTRMPGCTLTRENLNKILEITSPLTDGSQDEILKDVTANPEKYEMALVRKRARNAKTQQVMSFIMLYVRKIQKVAEQAF